MTSPFLSSLTPGLKYPSSVVSNADLAEALFQLAESHPPGELRLALLRAAYAVFDHPRELDGARRLPETVPLEVLPTVAMLRACRGRDAARRRSAPAGRPAPPARAARPARGF